MRKLSIALSVVVAIFAMATGAHAQSTVAIDQLPVRTLSHVLGHDSTGHAGREPVTDFIKPGSPSPTAGNIVCWGTTANLINDCGTLGTAATQNTGTSGHNLPFLDGFNTWSNGQTINSNSGGGWAQLVLNALNTSVAGQIVGQRNGVARWDIIMPNAGSEAGSNVGGDFVIDRYADNGTWIDIPFKINRSTGVVSLSQPLPVTSGGTGQTSVGTAISANTGTSGHVLGFLDGANIWSADQTILNTAGNAQLYLNAANGASSILRGQKSGSLRWQILLGDNSSESGSNAGSNFVITRFGDTGSSIDSPLNINRATGLTSINDGLSVTGATSLGATTATSVNKLAITAPATASTFTPANNSTLTTTSSTSIGQGQYLATATNDNAAAGNIGEYVFNQSTGSSLTSNTGANATSTSLAAGDWDVQCIVRFNPAGSTTVSSIQAAVTTASATYPGYPQATVLNNNFPTGSQQIISTPVTRISLSTTTTTYCFALSIFGTSTMTADGSIRARRVR